MQNKPNLLNAEMNVSQDYTRAYENEIVFGFRKNKPNQTQTFSSGFWLLTTGYWFSPFFSFFRNFSPNLHHFLHFFAKFRIFSHFFSLFFLPILPNPRTLPLQPSFSTPKTHILL
jgi:hypothetical protein